jgi:hypothetical protein
MLKKEKKKEICEKFYKFCYVLGMLESSKSYGLIEGGYAVNKDVLYKILKIGAERGFGPPSDEEIIRIIAAMQRDLTLRAIVEMN